MPGRSLHLPGAVLPPRSKRPLRATAGLVVAALAAAVCATAGDASASALATGSKAARPGAAPVVKRVTLVTGDVVQVRTAPDGRSGVVLEPGADGVVPQAAVTQDENHLYVVPEKAFPLLSRHRLDPALFDVTGLIDQGYDDASTARLPVIVDYGHGVPASREAKAAAPRAALRTVSLPALGAAAFAANKVRATDFWNSMTAGENSAGFPTTLAQGAAHVDLDATVHATLEDSVPQIHAPQAWAAGFDGTGVEVAVLDTGYDTTHPDLQGLVDQAANFTQEADTTDLNGHGTHVASTVAGSGAGSNGLRKGVAPGAHLLVGKVLDRDGVGQDSMVLAGMQWAVAQGADVVNMSLGGDFTDGTDPMAQAVDELSASSDTLFDNAAGNAGDFGPSSVTTPGTASSALTVGAVDVNDVLAPFSSRGPRIGDGAVKPEVVAPGVDVTAARAAGTSLGTPVDELYTTLSGTSMATPHVAGVAAILKQKHPDWTGEQLKAAIAGSSVPIDATTPFETGDGRVDALNAIDQDVVTDAVLDLGFFTWPHDNLPVSHHDLTYTNLGDAPVTLTLDGAALPTGVTLAADTVSLPAHGQGTVDVLVDPTLEGPGSFAGVIAATPDDGGVPVRTAVSYTLEDERYDLTVTVEPRAGTQKASHVISMSGVETGSFQQRIIDAAPGAQTVTWRVAPGKYSVAAQSFGLAGDDAQEGIVAFNPTLTVNADTEVTLDEASAAELKNLTSRPAVNAGSTFVTSWTDGASGFAGYTLTGLHDRVFAVQTDASVGTTDSSLNWMLVQPEGEVRLANGTTVGLSPVTQEGQGAWQADLRDETLTGRVVDAGSQDAVDTSAVDGAIGLVSGSCGDLTGAAAALAAAGATAMIAYPGTGATCAGHLTGEPPLPTLQVRPYDVAALHAGSPTAVRLAVHSNPKYEYDLQDSWTGTLPHGATLDGRDAAVGTRVEHIHSLGTTSRSQFRASQMWLGQIGDTGIAMFGLVRPVRMPSTVIHYASGGVVWQQFFDVIGDNGLFSEFGSPLRMVRPGTVKTDTWFGGPITPGVSKIFPADFAPFREDDLLFAALPPYVDDAGHTGGQLFNDELRLRVTVDGKKAASGNDMLRANFVSVPKKKSRIGYFVNTSRRGAFWKRSTPVRTFWGFDSAHPADGHAVLPLMGVDYDLGLSPLSTAPAGTHKIRIGFSMPRGVAEKPVQRASFEVSWNAGKTWKPVSLSRCFIGRHHDFVDNCSLKIENRRHAFAALRVSATDTAGRVVRQTIMDAYRIP